jgi:hypothetical protein
VAVGKVQDCIALEAEGLEEPALCRSSFGVFISVAPKWLFRARANTQHRIGGSCSCSGSYSCSELRCPDQGIARNAQLASVAVAMGLRQESRCGPLLQQGANQLRTSLPFLASALGFLCQFGSPHLSNRLLQSRENDRIRGHRSSANKERDA